ncbi:MAG: biotin/lipoyl-containing protein [Candidatus Bipolaricaulota bacterium]
MEGGTVDFDELRKLCILLREEGLSELTVEEEGRRITLRRAAVAPAREAPCEETEIAQEYVRSPVVGTFWQRPSPGQDPYVNPGDEVEPGQVLCLVEAMKVMNEVRADRAGVIDDILVEDGSPVEYGQPLFVLRTTP